MDGRVLPIAAIGFGYMVLSEASQPAWLLVALHLLVFFITAMACHGQLAQRARHASHLTEFYLWISVGGVLGGLFNAFAAPALFTRVAEYPAAMILALLPVRNGSRETSASNVLRSPRHALHQSPSPQPSPIRWARVQ